MQDADHKKRYSYQNTHAIGRAALRRRAAGNNGTNANNASRKRSRRDALRRKEILRRTQSKLSSVLRREPSCFSQNKISIVGKRVSILDRLPFTYSKVSTLYFSDNNIKSLEGIQQFENVHTISLGNNLIEDFETLRLVPQSTRALNLEGNPITRLPHYRLHVLHILPHIQQLDKHAVEKDEKQLARSIVKRESLVLERIVQSECEIIKLKRIPQLINLRMELQQLFYSQGPFSALRQQAPEPLASYGEHGQEQSGAGFSVDTFLSVCDFYGHLTDENRLRIMYQNRHYATRFWSALMMDYSAGGGRNARRGHPFPNELWDAAYAEVIRVQQQLKGKLLVRISQSLQNAL